MKYNQFGRSGFINLILGLLVILLLAIVVFQWEENITLKVSLNNESAGEEGLMTESPLSLNLSWQSGDVWVKRNGSGFTGFLSDSLLKEGDIIKTGNDGRAVLEFEKGGAVRLGNDTELVLTKLDEKEIILTQGSGVSYHRVVLDGGTEYKIDSLGQMIKARGTAFNAASFKDAREIKIDVIEGEIKVELKKEGKVEEEKTVEAGRTAIIDADGALAEVKDIDKENLKTVWYKWNKEEDAKGAYDLGVLEEIDMDEINKEENKEEEEAGDSKGGGPEEKKDEMLTLWGTAQSDGVHLSWTPYDGEGFAYYKIVRSEDNPDLKYPDDGYIKVSDDKNFSSYIDSAVKNGVSYYYRVCAKIKNEIKCGNVIKRTAVNAPGEYLQDDGQMEDKEGEITEKKDEQKQISGFIPISDSLQLTAVKEGNNVNLSWTPSISDGFKYYKVVRSEINPNLYYPADGYIYYSTDKNLSSYIDSGLEVGKTYFYRICDKEESGEVWCGNVATIEN